MHHLTIGSNTYEVVDQAGRASIAPDYDSTSTYAVGDLVLHEGQLYECNTAISTAEAWTAAHWTSKTVAAEVTSLIGDITEKLDAPSVAGTSGQVLATDGDGGTYWTNSGGGGSSPSPYTSNPAALGTASPGSSDAYARGDHVHPKPTAADLGITVPSASSATPQALGSAAAGSSSDYSRADHVHAKPTASDIGAAPAVTEVTVATDGAVTQALDAGKIYHFTGTLTSLTITLNAAASGQLAEYHFDFDCGSTAPTVTIPQTVTMPDSQTFDASKHYEVDILNNYGVAVSWGISA